MHRFFYIFLALALVGCGSLGTDIVTTVPFSASEVSYINKRGNASITGQAFLRQRGGGVVTCAGEEVNLFPAGTYAKQRFTQIYGSVQGGQIRALQGANDDGEPGYLRMRRVAVCDAEGDFEFSGVADGDYYVQSRVLWNVGDSFIPEGGAIARLVQVRGGRSQRVILN